MNVPFIWVKNIGRTFVRFVTIHAFDRQTDRRTDGQLLIAIPRLHSCSAVKMVRFFGPPCTSDIGRENSRTSSAQFWRWCAVILAATEECHVLLVWCVHGVGCQWSAARQHAELTAVVGRHQSRQNDTLHVNQSTAIISSIRYLYVASSSRLRHCSGIALFLFSFSSTARRS